MYRADLMRIHADHIEVPAVEADGGELPDALSHGRCDEEPGGRLKAARARGGRRTVRPPAPLPIW